MQYVMNNTFSSGNEMITYHEGSSCREYPELS